MTNRRLSVFSKGAMTDLGTLLGGSSSIAHGMNDGGQVVGWADTSGGNWHAFRAFERECEVLRAALTEYQATIRPRQGDR
jgi:uncharacterized membrane protein